MKENIKLILLFLLIVTVAGCKVYDITTQEAKFKEAETNFNYCIEDAEENHRIMWDRQCADKGLIDNCHLPADAATMLTQITNTDRSNCLRYYMKQK